jgi:methyl-accepting chemotaxis protein
MGKVDNGAELLSRTNAAFEKMEKSNVRVGHLVAEIAAGSGEQATGIEQINKAVSEIDKVIQTNAANSESNVGASGEMKASAEKMRTYVMALAAIVTGRRDLSPGQKSPGASAPRHSTGGAGSAPVAGPVRKAPAPGSTREVNPEQILPLDNEDFEDF